MHVWLNGSLLPRPDAPALTVADHGFTVGDGVFETLKVLDGVPFALTRHLDRLGVSASGLGLPWSRELLASVRDGVDQVLAAEHLDQGRLRITVTGGPAPMGSGRGEAPPTVVVAAGPMAPLPSSTEVVTVPWPRNERGATAGLKTTSYAENVIALARATEEGATEALLPNTRDHVCEGTGSNVFYVVDGELRTPTLASGCLAGVTRALVIEWNDVREVDEPVEVLAGASEVFLVSTTRDVQAVSRLDGRELPAPGPVTAEVAAVWSTRSRENLDP